MALPAIRYQDCHLRFLKDCCRTAEQYKSDTHALQCHVYVEANRVTSHNCSANLMLSGLSNRPGMLRLESLT